MKQTGGKVSHLPHWKIVDNTRAGFELMKEEFGSCNYKALMRNKTAEQYYMTKKSQPSQDIISQQVV
ncbi:hypothetical protein FHG87_006153 [Trinorchestia longiramus]|nr:hypothetical protein FHG87_006153 [Trinorchestia longiramus]